MCVFVATVYLLLVQCFIIFMPIAEGWFLRSEVLWLQNWAQWGSWKMPDGTKLFWFLIHKEPNLVMLSIQQLPLKSGPRPVLLEVFCLVHWIDTSAQPALFHSWALRIWKEMIVSVKCRDAEKPLGKTRDWCPTIPFFTCVFSYVFFILVLSLFSVYNCSTLSSTLI